MLKTVLTILGGILGAAKGFFGWLSSRKDQKLGRLEATNEQAVAGKRVDDRVREVAETPVSDDDVVRRLRDGSA